MKNEVNRTLAVKKATNNTIINSIMKKHICVLLLFLCASTNVWGVTVTLKVWDTDNKEYVTWNTFEKGNKPGYGPSDGGSIYNIAWAPGDQKDSKYPTNGGSNNGSTWFNQYGYPESNYNGSATTLYAVYQSIDDTEGGSTYYYTTKPAKTFSDLASGGTPHTVSFSVGYGAAPSSRTGTSVTLPSIPALCSDAVDEGWLPYGWSTASVAVNSSSATIVGEPGDIYLPDADRTLYAVYIKPGTTLTSSTTFSMQDSQDEDSDPDKYMPTEGYVILTKISTPSTAISNSISTNYLSQIGSGEVTYTTVMTTTNANCVWIVDMPTDGEFRFKNLVTGQYLGLNEPASIGATNTAGALLSNGASDAVRWTVSEATSHGYMLKNKAYSSYYLRYNSDGKGWRGYSSRDGTNDNIYIWKQTTVSVSGSKYQSSLPLCALKVYYDANGGSGTMTDANNYDFEDVVTVMSNTFTAPTGYSFAYWTADYQLEGDDEYLIGAPIPAGTEFSMPAASVTFTAQWTPNGTLITLDKGTGTKDGAATVFYDATELDAIEHATNITVGYHLIGYYTNDDVQVLTSGGEFAAANISGYVTDGKWSNTSDKITLYAHWALYTYTVSFDLHGHGDAVSSQEVETGSLALKPTPDPSEDGWRFLGWYDAASDGTEWDFSTGITANTTIHAKWEAVTYSTEYKAWCDPDIEITGDIHLTSVNGIYVHSTATTGNLLHITSEDLAGVTKLDIRYLDADNGDAEVANASSLFRLCNDGTDNYNVADGSQIDVSASNTCDLTYSIKYTPNAYNVTNHYKLQITMKRGTRNVKTVTHDLYGRALPEEFVIASKFNGEWYALPNTLEATESAAKAVAGIRITVDNTTTPTKAVYAPNTTVYKGEGRYAAGTNIYGVRLTDGTNHLQVSSTESNNLMWLSPTGSAANQDWWLSSSDFEEYSLTIPSVGTKKLGMVGGNIGYYASPTSPSEKIYLLPIENKLTDNPASVTEWGQHSVILDVDAQDAASASVHFGDRASAEKSDAFGQTLTSVKSAATKYNYTVSFSTTDFPAHKGELLYIDWLDGDDDIVSTSAITIPWIIASSGTMSTIESRKTYWQNEEVHVLPGVTLTADAGTFSDVTIKQLEIYPGATVKVTTGTLNVADLVLRYGWTRANGKSYDVAQLQIKRGDGGANLTTTRAYADWYIDYDQYYPIAVPWTVTTSGMSYKNSNSAASAGVKMRYYDGEQRANTGQAMIGQNWKEYNEEGVSPAYPETLEPSTGYAMTARRPTGKAFSIVRMPLSIPSPDWTALGEQGEVSGTHKDQVSVTGWGLGTTTPWYAMGWNFIGNPYMSTFNGDDEGISGKLQYQNGGSIRYATIPDIEFRNYDQVNIAEANLKPASGFFVQANNADAQTITFASSQIVAPSAPARFTNTQETMPEQEVYIRLSDEDEQKDQMGLIIGEDYTAAYEPNADLVKVLGDANALKTYMHYADMDMAYVAVNETLAQEWIPVTVRIPSEGSYTFSLTNASVVEQLEGVYLMDYENDAVTNLLESNYTFYTPAGTNGSRFAINAIIGVRDTPTGIDAVNGKTDTTQPVKFLYRDNVYILHNGVIYDATGKKVQ